MRKTIVALVAAIAFLSTGCTIQVGSDSTESASPSVSQSPSIQDMTDEEYADFMREQVPSFNDVPTGLLVDNAETICEALDSGLAVDDVVRMLLESGLSPKEGGSLLAGAIMFRCPEYRDAVSPNS